MKVESSKSRHCPYNFGKHAERYYNKEVCVDFTQFVNKLRSFQLFRLQDLKTLLYRIFFYIALYDFSAPSSLFIGHCNDCGNIISLVNKFCKACDCEFRRSEKNYF